MADKQARIVVNNHWEDGPHPIYEIDYDGHRLAFFHPGVGAAISAGLLEEAIAFGCRKFIVCGGCGVLEFSVEEDLADVLMQGDEYILYYIADSDEILSAEFVGKA